MGRSLCVPLLAPLAPFQHILVAGCSVMNEGNGTVRLPAPVVGLVLSVLIVVPLAFSVKSG